MGARRRAAALPPLLMLAAQLQSAAGFYLPGMAQRDYGEGDPVGPIKVNSLFSHDGVLPYDFYSVKFCAPPKDELRAKMKDQKLGEIIYGDRIGPSLYYAEMKKDVACRLVPCEKGQREVSEADLKLFEKRINEGYRGAFVLDNLPIVSNGSYLLNGACPSGKQVYDSSLRGWPLGVPRRCLGKETYINNHVAFTIKYNEVTSGRYTIVGFYGVPHSVRHKSEEDCGPNFKVPPPQSAPVNTDPTQTKEILWSYSVTWEPAEIAWGHRWDAYLSISFSNRNARVHWLAIINSLLIILCLSGVVAMIMLRTLHMDFNRYNSADDADEAQEEVGWKLVHADVFRPPPHVNCFVVFIGTGVQLLLMGGSSLTFALFGFLSPANRGGLLTALILLFVLMALANGYVVGAMLNMFEARSWRTVCAAGMAYPALAFLSWLLEDIVLFLRGANAVPPKTVLSLMGLWFGICLPLVVLGASFGFRREVLSPGPCRVSKIPRQVPPQKAFLNLPVLCVLPGIIPFGAAFIELRFILSSLWQGMVYYVFGFLALSCLTVVIATVEVTIVIVYFLLVYEDHRWWWRSIAIPSGMGLHFLLYCVYYFATQLNIRSLEAAFVFFEFAGMVAITLSLMVGTIGFMSAWWFVRTIYSSIKVE